uniref:Uncharacterized protein n=1 Tax=Anguilla anguilla TaxID=7936 RepID=A0A0E9R970_ANGAN
MLPEWEQLDGDAAHLRLLHAAGRGGSLYNAHGRDGGATEEDSWVL